MDTQNQERIGNNRMETNRGRGNTSNNGCFECGNLNHFARECPIRAQNYRNKEIRERGNDHIRNQNYANNGAPNQYMRNRYQQGTLGNTQLNRNGNRYQPTNFQGYKKVAFGEQRFQDQNRGNFRQQRDTGNRRGEVRNERYIVNNRNTSNQRLGN